MYKEINMESSGSFRVRFVKQIRFVRFGYIKYSSSSVCSVHVPILFGSHFQLAYSQVSIRTELMYVDKKTELKWTEEFI